MIFDADFFEELSFAFFVEEFSFEPDFCVGLSGDESGLCWNLLAARRPRTEALENVTIDAGDEGRRRQVWARKMCLCRHSPIAQLRIQILKVLVNSALQYIQYR